MTIFSPTAIMAIFHYPEDDDPFDVIIEKSAEDSTPLAFEFDLEAWEVGQINGGN